MNPQALTREPKSIGYVAQPVQSQTRDNPPRHQHSGASEYHREGEVS
jgi:hypothetical protein